MQLKSTLLFLASLATFTSALPHTKRGGDWTSTPSNGQFATEAFGKRNSANSGTIDLYQGNTGDPWGSNIAEISASDAPRYKYVAEVSGQNKEPWKVRFWNKFGPDGKQDGHYGQSALEFTLSPGEKKYVAFDENTQGGLTAVPAGEEFSTGQWGAYASTYGEFDFGNGENSKWVGFDVSAIQAEKAGKPIQGMQICDAKGSTCSSISGGGKNVHNAYMDAQEHIGGIGGNLPAGPARLAIVIAYEG